MLQRLWRQSQTKAWAYTQGLGAAGMGVLDGATSFVSDPHTKDYLSALNVPNYVWVILATMAFITWLVHGRSDA